MELGEEREIIYTYHYCHRQTDSCIKMGSDESSFNVSLIARDKIRSQCPQTTNFEKRRSRSEVPLLSETMRLIMLGTGRRGEGVWRWGRKEIIYLSLHCHHQNDFCIKMGSDESHFNVSVGSDGQSYRTTSTNHNLFEEKGEPKRYRTEVLPLTSLRP